MPTIIADQSDELSRVKAKIQKLAAKTIDNGCTEHEANAAMDKIGELLMLFNLSLDEVLLNTEHCIQSIYWTGMRRGMKISYCTCAIASFCDCILYRTRGDNKQGFGYSFFGLESDVQMAMYLCNLIDKAIQTEVEKYKSTDPVYVHRDTWAHRKTLSSNFIKGMAINIRNRLDDMKEDRRRQEEDKHYDDLKNLREHLSALNPTSREIVPIHVQKKKKVKDAFGSLGIKLSHYAGTRSVSHSGARQAGAAAGARVNLSRPINSKGQRLLD